MHAGTPAQSRSSPFQEVQGRRAQLDHQGHQENLGHQGHRGNQDPVGQEVSQARMETQEFLGHLEKKATKAVKESKDYLDSMDCQVRRGSRVTLDRLQPVPRREASSSPGTVRAQPFPPVRKGRSRSTVGIRFFSCKAMSKLTDKTWELLEAAYSDLPQCHSYSVTSTMYVTSHLEMIIHTGCQQQL